MSQPLLNPYRLAWLLVFFDLPVKTQENRKEAGNFRKEIIKDGYIMLQLSVYARPCPTRDKLETHLRRLKRKVPPDGEVRALMVTDAQWGRMDIYSRREKILPEKRPDQLLLF